MFTSDRILALDIGTSALKLAEFLPRKSGSVELINFAVGFLGLGPSDDDERSNYLTITIREMMRERQIKPGRVLLTVSGQTVFSRFVMLPPVDKDKISKIVAYEAQQNVPFPIEEVVWDYQLIGSGNDELGVMLAAIKGEIIESIIAAVEGAGLITDLVDVAPMAIYNAARYNYADPVGCQLLIDIGARSTDLIFLEPGHLFIRSIPSGAEPGVGSIQHVEYVRLDVVQKGVSTGRHVVFPQVASGFCNHAEKIPAQRPHGRKQRIASVKMQITLPNGSMSVFFPDPADIAVGHNLTPVLAAGTQKIPVDRDPA